MISPYLEQPFVPLAEVLPKLLDNIEAETRDTTRSTEKKSQLRQRAELVSRLLAAALPASDEKTRTPI